MVGLIPVHLQVVNDRISCRCSLYTNPHRKCMFILPATLNASNKGAGCMTFLRIRTRRSGGTCDRLSGPGAAGWRHSTRAGDHSPARVLHYAGITHGCRMLMDGIGAAKLDKAGLPVLSFHQVFRVTAKRVGKTDRTWTCVLHPLPAPRPYPLIPALPYASVMSAAYSLSNWPGQWTSYRASSASKVHFVRA